jgi:hypothetical protein
MPSSVRKMIKAVHIMAPCIESDEDDQDAQSPLTMRYHIASAEVEVADMMDTSADVSAVAYDTTTTRQLEYPPLCVRLPANWLPYKELPLYGVPTMAMVLVDLRQRQEKMASEASDKTLRQWGKLARDAAFVMRPRSSPLTQNCITVK